MKTYFAITQWPAVLACSIIGLFTGTGFAQGTAFTYQGWLNSGGSLGQLSRLHHQQPRNQCAVQGESVLPPETITTLTI